MLTKLQNQPLKSTKHKRFKACMVPISNNFVSISKAHSLRALAPLGIFAKSLTGVVGNSGRAPLSILALFLTNFTICNVASALSISVPQTISFDIVSGKASHSEAATIEILSDDALAGYTLTLSGSETLDASKSENGSLNKITSEEWTNESSFDDNTWGLKYCTKLNDADDCISTTAYKATSNSEALQIDKTAVNNSQPVKYALSIGAKTSGNINADTYSNTFTLAATPNPVYHSVGFVDWTENMPDAIAGTGTTINIPSNIPTKPGYTFAGWCKSKPIANRTYCADPVEAESGESYDLVVENGVAYTNLYATWKYNTACLNFDTTIVRNMQDVETWGDCLSVGMQISAKDTRDNNIYTVGRLPDGKIWLLDNLRLTSAAGDLSYEDTNVPENWEGFDDDGTKSLPTSSINEFTYDNVSFTTPAINTSNINYTKGNDEISAASAWKGGVYYNYAAASAGTIRFKIGANNKNAEYDICPKGWRMPTGGPNGEFQGLYTVLGGKYLRKFDGGGNTLRPYASSEIRIEFRNALHIPFAGFFWNKNAGSVGFYGVFWSSTMQNSDNMYSLHITTDSITPQDAYNRYNGFSIRCVAK